MEVDSDPAAEVVLAMEAAIERERAFGIGTDADLSEDRMAAKSTEEEENDAAVEDIKREHEEADAATHKQMLDAQYALRDMLKDPWRLFATFSAPMTTENEPIRGAARRAAVMEVLGDDYPVQWFAVDLENGDEPVDVLVFEDKMPNIRRRVFEPKGFIHRSVNVNGPAYPQRLVIVCENYDVLLYEEQQRLFAGRTLDKHFLLLLVEARYPSHEGGSIPANFWRVA